MTDTKHNAPTTTEKVTRKSQRTSRTTKVEPEEQRETTQLESTEGTPNPQPQHYDQIKESLVKPSLGQHLQEEDPIIPEAFPAQEQDLEPDSPSTHNYKVARQIWAHRRDQTKGYEVHYSNCLGYEKDLQAIPGVPEEVLKEAKEMSLQASVLATQARDREKEALQNWKQIPPPYWNPQEPDNYKEDPCDPLGRLPDYTQDPVNDPYNMGITCPTPRSMITARFGPQDIKNPTSTTPSSRSSFRPAAPGAATSNKDPNKSTDLIANILADPKTHILSKVTSTQDAPERLVHTGKQIISAMAHLENVQTPLAAAGFCALMNAGAYLKNVTNRTVNVNGHVFSKKMLLLAADKVKCKYTLRAICRAMRDDIYRVCDTISQQGHLATAYRISNPTLASTDYVIHAYYCADFHLDNPNAPMEVRTFLSQREVERKAQKRRKKK